MSIESEREKNSDGTESIYVFDTATPEDKHLSFLVDKDNDRIEFYPKDDFPVKTVELIGFKKIPPEISELGYFKAGLGYYFSKKLQGMKVKSFRITKGVTSTLRNYTGGATLTFGYDEFRDLKGKLTELSNENKLERSLAIDEFFHNQFPSKFQRSEVPAKRRAKRAVRNLDSSIIEHMEAADVEKFLDFMEHLLEDRYSSSARRHKLFGAAKLKVDEVALKETIRAFEEKLNQDDSEKSWGQFLHKHLYLIEPKYVHVIPELNLVLGGQRYVDFGMVDSHGYLDVFEIKKPTTQLLAKSQDRGNYYWSTETVKAIAQAEKYLFNADRKAANLAEDIRREKSIEVSVIRPRAILVIGKTNQLDDVNKETDFRVLKMALKNIDIVTYDELLQRLKNQMSKVYLG